MEVLFVQLASSAHVVFVEYLTEDELFMCAVCSLEELEANCFKRTFYLLWGCNRLLFILNIPLRRYKLRESLIAWDIDGKISVEIEKLIHRDIPFWRDGN